MERQGWLIRKGTGSFFGRVRVSAIANTLRPKNVPVPLVPRGYDVVRILMALVLLTAAFLKAYQLSSEPVIGHSILDSRWLLMLAVEFELFFGCWRTFFRG